MLENKTNHYYTIRSKHREDIETPVNFKVRAHKLNHIKSFKIKNVIIPFTWYPINSNNNQLIIFKTGDTQDRFINVESGDYNLTQLKLQLVTKLDALLGPAQTYTITDNNITHKITISQNNSSFIIRGASSIKNILGLSDLDTLANITHTAPDIFNISGTNVVDVRSDALTKFGSKVKESNHINNGLLFTIPISNYKFGDIIQFEPDDYIYDIHPDAEDEVDIKLVGEEGQSLGGNSNLNGQNIIIVLQFHSYKDNHPHLYNKMDSRYRRYGEGKF